MARGAGLYAADLFRLLRLFGHGRRSFIAHRSALAIQLQLAIQGDQHHRLLATLAHDAVAVPPRLSLRPPRGQSTRFCAALSEPHDHDAFGRSLAWCIVDVRDLGWP